MCVLVNFKSCTEIPFCTEKSIRKIYVTFYDYCIAENDLFIKTICYLYTWNALSELQILFSSFILRSEMIKRGDLLIVNSHEKRKNNLKFTVIMNNSF